MKFKEKLKQTFPFLKGITQKPAQWRERLSYVGTPVMDGEAFNRWMLDRVESRTPTCVCRLGRTELTALNHYIENGANISHSRSEQVINNLYICSGVFPPTPETLSKFTKVYFDCLPEIDLTGVWYNKGEKRLLKQHAGQTQFTELKNLEPHYVASPWPVLVSGLRILVITPFVQSSKVQVEKLSSIWPQYRGLFRECNFKFIQAPPFAAMVTPRHKNWHDGLDDLKAQIDAIDYDLLVVGAGAWGLPLAVHAKRHGKIGYHLGGATQLLFGIKGRRWDTHPVISKLYNEHWIRPLDSEIPKKKAIFEEAEGTGYW